MFHLIAQIKDCYLICTWPLKRNTWVSASPFAFSAWLSCYELDFWIWLTWLHYFGKKKKHATWSGEPDSSSSLKLSKAFSQANPLSSAATKRAALGANHMKVNNKIRKAVSGKYCHKFWFTGRVYISYLLRNFVFEFLFDGSRTKYVKETLLWWLWYTISRTNFFTFSHCLQRSFKICLWSDYFNW